VISWRGEDAKTALDQRLGKVQTLIISTTSTMHDQYRRTITGDRVLDRPAGCLEDLAPNRDALARLMNIALIVGKDSSE